MNFQKRVVGALLAACVLTAAPSFAADSTTVMTYNIRYLNTTDGEDVWENRQDAVIETLRGADLVGLQEVVLAQLQAVQKATPEWTWYGVGRDDGKEGGEMAPIGFRSDRFKSIDQGTLWLSDRPEVAGSIGWDAALPRTLTWVLLESTVDASRLLVLNTHFDHRGEAARQNAGKLLAQRVDTMAKEVPVIAMGDFNAGPESIPITNATAGLQVPLQDSREITTEPPRGPVGTWNGFKAINPKTRIDHILVSKGVRVLSHEVLDPKTAAGRFASDHCPVVVSVQY